ncbi:MAG: PH domain-containing protein [Caldisericaceae bacterium]
MKNYKSSTTEQLGEIRGSLIFRPKYSKWAYVFLSLIIIFVALVLGGVIWVFKQEGSAITTIILRSIPFGLLLIFLLFGLLIYHTMRYEIRDDGLYLVCGPFYSKIDYGKIKSLEKTDLTLDVTSSWRIPGYALFNVPYGNKGIIKMYSTSALKNILLIKTSDGKQYGITPADEEGFLKELEARIKGNR